MMRRIFPQISGAQRYFSATAVSPAFDIAANSDVQLISTIADFRQKRKTMGDNVGFVPTMGNLHKGHVSLMRMAREKCDVVVSSLFVNPAQFAAGEDFGTYPRTLEKDLAMMKSAGVDCVFVPDTEELYPSGHFEADSPVGTCVEVFGKSSQMEGQIRPFFFRGVATVCCKLFNIVHPNVVFFGQKDAQQCVVIKNLIRDLCMPIEMVIGETVREPDGLAMSSRNNYLTKEERIAGTILNQGLKQALSLYQSGVRDRTTLITSVEEVIRNEPLASLEYISLADTNHLIEVDKVGQTGAVLSGAIKLPATSTRLIDNRILAPS